MGIKRYVDSLRRGLRRPEVRRNPFHAIYRRLLWRWHWRGGREDAIVINHWWRNLSITLPNTGNAALLFYRTHSDPGLVWLLQALLAPRMTFLDVGAHIGEYSMIAAGMVGAEGKVVSIDPLPRCVEAVRRNASLNGLTHVKVYNGALCSYSGKIGFQSDNVQSAGWIAANPNQATFETQCWTLDDFLPFAGIAKAHVMKLDAGGNEISVLRGGVKTLCNGGIGTLAMKLYHPDVTRERFGYDCRESLALLQQWGFRLKLLIRQDAFPIFRPEDVNAHYDRLVYCHLLVATKG